MASDVPGPADCKPGREDIITYISTLSVHAGSTSFPSFQVSSLGIWAEDLQLSRTARDISTS